MSTKRSTPESQVLKAVTDYLKICRIGTVRRVNTGMIWQGGSDHPWGPKGRPVRFGEPGHSDLIVELLDGRTAYIEVKSAKGKPTKLQLDFLERQRSRGCPAFIVRSVSDCHRELTTAGFIVPDPNPRRIHAGSEQD